MQVSRDPSRRRANRQGDWATASWVPFREGTITERCCLLHKGYGLILSIGRVHTQRVLCYAGDRPIPSKTGGGDLDGDVVSDPAFPTPTHCSL